MKTSIELSIQLIETKIERVKHQRELLSQKAARVVAEMEKQDEVIGKLEAEKQKLQSSKAYQKLHRTSTDQETSSYSDLRAAVNEPFRS
jgi:chromosome segregation ATPase